MAMTRCVECGREISSGAKVCPNCGKSDPTATTAAKVFAAVVMVAMAGGIFLFCSGFMTGDGSGSDGTSAAAQKVRDMEALMDRGELPLYLGRSDLGDITAYMGRQSDTGGRTPSGNRYVEYQQSDGSAVVFVLAPASEGGLILDHFRAD